MFCRVTGFESLKQRVACLPKPASHHWKYVMQQCRSKHFSLHCIGWLGACAALLAPQAAQLLALSLLCSGPALRQITYHNRRWSQNSARRWSQNRGERPQVEESDRRWRRAIASGGERSKVEGPHAPPTPGPPARRPGRSPRYGPAGRGAIAGGGALAGGGSDCRRRGAIAGGREK